MFNNPYMYTNPMQPQFNRLQQMEQQYIQQPMQQNIIKVENEQEAKAAQISVDGKPTYFIAKDKIFIKKFSFDTGKIDFTTFVMVDSEIKDETITNIYDERLKSIEAKLDGLQETLINTNVKKKEVKNNE